ncbi:LOW QUALITY PROTEIN: uncharacterized protein LOC105736596 [Apis florea]|uniref:LOW QUALITY PROTEIN: uncharacterized protein LOC105736596 n=1 Tax=Apis florea TaxID=7463 RepID=UPI0012FE8856|nr:LOW QUALITY PROTEIN: uncharacterized protein LOC105736596 [Apis florea]
MEYRLKLSLIDDDEVPLFISIAINFAHVRFGNHAFADNVALQRDSVRFARICNVSDIRVICGEQVIRKRSIIIFDQLQKEFSRFYSAFMINLQQRRNRSSFSPFFTKIEIDTYLRISRSDRNVETGRGIPSLSFVASLNCVDLLHASRSSLQPVPGTLSTCRYSAPGHHVDFMRFYSHIYRIALQKSVVFVVDR